MKYMVESSQDTYEELPSNYLISCIQDGTVTMMQVLTEFISYLSEDSIREINDALALYDIID